ncbi:protein EARLY RESPONSIVE TO DEHYDRATION 15-like isoform X2 [Canna indica]|uniref:Protein EARLY RESPONSIVE TO DEHYDRATION 15-like isoform X2 n=1 Tax=Canna indica TaxID=4628 RepID=A0AAQ3K7P5_9LILI|nr:protein EARLY RESPONSIVE TO DEHYDRATION 15-like isoform X2 [Canna indica]
MSTMAVSSGVARKSTLNPDAPLFIPMAFQQVEDFSPEWWELVKTTTWFREHWFDQHQDQETFDGDDEEDIANLLPDSFDLGIGDALQTPEAEYDDAGYDLKTEAISMTMKERVGSDVEAVVRSLGLKSPTNGARPILEAAKYREKPVQHLSPKYSSRHNIQQPR